MIKWCEYCEELTDRDTTGECKPCGVRGKKYFAAQAAKNKPPKTKLQIDLDADDSTKWMELSARPEFKGTSKAGVISRLMASYLNPQQQQNPFHYTPSKPIELVQPQAIKLDAKEQRDLEYKKARDEKITYWCDKARAGEVPWPKWEPMDQKNGLDLFTVPFSWTDMHAGDGSQACIYWTPPDDYPKEMIGVRLTQEEKDAGTSEYLQTNYRAALARDAEKRATTPQAELDAAFRKRIAELDAADNINENLASILDA